jgi:gamma-glutamylcyclotransferase (GGCT)/AIG2-like uncharacterized protein YtfP
MVYGTLMRGERNHRQMKGARFVRKARTAARFTLVDRGAFPALLQEGATSVCGELYEVTAEHLARLDWFEGVPRLYERRTIRLADGARAQAYVQPMAPFQGTARQIVQQMKDTAQRADHLTLDAYVDWCAQNGAVMGHDVKIEGQDEDARCASLVSEMVRLGIAEKL